MDGQWRSENLQIGHLEEDRQMCSQEAGLDRINVS